MDFSLSSEQVRWQRIARDFANDVIKPTASDRDRLATAEERIPWDWIRMASEVGLRTLGVPHEYGGAGADILTMSLAGEELAVGDLGFAVIMDQCWKMAGIFGGAMSAEQRDRFIPRFVEDPEATLAIAITEPEVGSDHQGLYDDSGIDFRTVARREGAEYVINGRKRYVSNGCMAKLYFVAARTNPEAPLANGVSFFVVPADTPGFRVGRFHEKSSQRLATNGEFYFEDCRVPAGNLLLGEGTMGRLRSEYMPGGKPEAAATALGVGRAAYEYALEYARRRHQGGRPIVEHQAVAMMLAEMAMKLDAARTQIWKAAWAADNSRDDARLLGLLAKVNAADVAFEACRLATEVLGGAAIMHEHPVEKFLRDSVSFIHSDGTKQVCLLRAAQALSGRSPRPLFGF